MGREPKPSASESEAERVRQDKAARRRDVEDAFNAIEAEQAVDARRRGQAEAKRPRQRSSTSSTGSPPSQSSVLFVARVMSGRRRLWAFLQSPTTKPTRRARTAKLKYSPPALETFDFLKVPVLPPMAELLANVWARLSETERALLVDRQAKESDCDEVLDHHIAQVTGYVEGLKPCPKCGRLLLSDDKRRVLHPACRKARQMQKRLARMRADNEKRRRQVLDEHTRERLRHKSDHCGDRPCWEAQKIDIYLADRKAEEKRELVVHVADIGAQEEIAYRSERGWNPRK